jgi:hypothetical protein
MGAALALDLEFIFSTRIERAEFPVHKNNTGAGTLLLR